MPTVAIVDGVKVLFFADEHPPPHFHLAFAEYGASVEIATLRVIHGSLPPAKLKVVLRWAAARRAELAEAWEAVVTEKRSPGKIR